MIVTVLQLTKVCPMPLDRAHKVVKALNEICPLYGMDSADILHEFIANAAHESGNFGTLEENLNYSAKRLTQVWPHRFPDLATAQKYSGNPKLLAEKVYGKRKDLGNVQVGDGWLFRGGGFIQLTGRNNYTLFLNYYNKNFTPQYTLSQMADLIRYDYKYAMHSACWFFAIAKNLIPLAISDDMKTIVKRINGGYIGLDHRTRLYELAKKYIV